MANGLENGGNGQGEGKKNASQERRTH